MEFEHSEKVRALQARVTAFMAEQIYPNEEERRAKLFVDRVDADAVAYQLRRIYPRLTQDIEVTPAVQPTALVYSSNGRNRIAIV